jgi:hypothetical protein
VATVEPVTDSCIVSTDDAVVTSRSTVKQCNEYDASSGANVSRSSQYAFPNVAKYGGYAPDSTANLQRFLMLTTVVELELLAESH